MHRIPSDSPARKNSTSLGPQMTADELQLFLVFVDQVERALETSARLFDQAEAGTLPAAAARHAGASLRELASQARWVRSLLPPAAPLVM